MLHPIAIRGTIAILIQAVLGCIACSVGAQTITGSGSTFVYPAMSHWIRAYAPTRPALTITYEPVGSSLGIEQFQSGLVDFAATDGPLSDSEIARMPQLLVQIPVIAGAEVLAYNLPGIGMGLRLTGDVIADIYLGKITQWNDTRIQEQNPNMRLPSLTITVCHRSDGSGTTYLFTKYLSTVSSTWRMQVGTARSVNWPRGLGANGNDGVATKIRAVPGAIGYVELATAEHRKLTYGPVRNRRGRFITASVAGIAAAENSAIDKMRRDMRVSIVDQPGDDVYPICGFSYLLIPRAAHEAFKTTEISGFLHWILGPGQAVAESLLYAPLPRAIVELDLTILSTGADKLH